MKKIMTECFNSLFITLLLLAIIVISPTNVWAQKPQMGGCDGDNHVHVECNKRFIITYQGVTYNCLCNCTDSRNTEKDCQPVSGTGGSSSHAGSSQSFQMQVTQTLVSSFLDGFMKGLFATPDNSQREKYDQAERQRQLDEQLAEEQRKRAEEQRNKKAREDWEREQAEAETEKKIDEANKITIGNDMIQQMQTVGNERKLEPFSVGNPKLDIDPISKNTYTTSNFNDYDRLLCAAYFSNLAKNSTKDVDARFYADQAQRVMAGESTYVECRMPKVSDDKAEKLEKVKILYNEMNVKYKDFQDIESKLQETRDKIKKAELKKEEATAKLTELQNDTATAKPEEKPQGVDPLKAAQEALRDADQELNQAKQSESEYLDKEKQLEKELNDSKTQIKNEIQPGDK